MALKILLISAREYTQRVVDIFQLLRKTTYSEHVLILRATLEVSI